MSDSPQAPSPKTLERSQGKKRRGPFVAAIAGAAVVLIAGAVILVNTAGRGGQAAADAEATFVQALNLDVVQDWDPAKTWSNTGNVFRQTYETLIVYDNRTQTFEPLLAESWERSDDGAVWTFILRDDVKFHTGKTLTAEDVKASIERNIDAESSNTTVWNSLDSIDVRDERTVEFTFEYPTSAERALAESAASSIYDTEAADAGQDLYDWFNEANDAGTGPYTVESWTKGSETEVTLTRFDDYWGGWDGSHYSRIELRVVPDETTRWQQLQAGDINAFDPVNAQILAQAKSSDLANAEEKYSSRVLIAQYNTASGPLADANVRKAITAAFDYDGIATTLEGAVKKAGYLVGPGRLGYSDEFASPSQDLAEAAELLAASGYGPGGAPLTLDLTYAQGNEAQEIVVNLLASTLKELNVTLNSSPLQWSTQWDRAKSDDAAQHQDIFIEYFPAGSTTDGWSSVQRLLRSESPTVFNLSYVNNAELDARIDQLLRLAVEDPDKAQSEYEDIQRLALTDEAYLGVIYQAVEYTVYSADVAGETTSWSGTRIYDLGPAD